MQAVRVLSPAMADAQSGRFAVVAVVAIDDIRMGNAALRMLVALGTYADVHGWCYPKQKTLATRLGISRQSVSSALRDLASMGYIEIHAQYNAATGQRVESRYRIVMDVQIPREYLREPRPDITPPVNLELTTHVKPTFTYPPENFTGDDKPTFTSHVKPTFTAIEELTHKNTPIEHPNTDMSVSAEREVFEHYKAKIQPAARIGAADKIRTRLKTFSADELKRGIDNFAADPWWMKNNAARGAAWFFHSDQRSEQFLYLKPRSAEPATRRRDGTAPPRRDISEGARRAAAEWESIR